MKLEKIIINLAQEGYFCDIDPINGTINESRERPYNIRKAISSSDINILEKLETVWSENIRLTKDKIEERINNNLTWVACVNDQVIGVL
jgi:hypothetical protein